MALDLELDGTVRAFRPGDPITGRVRVATATSTGRPLIVAVSWRTTGEGDVDAGDEQVVELAAPDAAIDGRTFPFSVPAPSGPLSYRGRTFSLEWRVEARLGLSSQPGASSWQDITIAADPDAPVRGVAAKQLFWLTGRNTALRDDGATVLPRERVIRLLEDQELFDSRAQPTQLGCLTLVFAAGVLGLLAFPVLMTAEWLGAGETASNHGMTIVFVLAALLVAVMLALLAVERRMERHLGLTISLADRIVRPGDDLVCTIGVRPSRPITIAGAEVCVVAEESSTGSSPGEAGDTTRVELFQSTVAALASRAFRTGTSEQCVVRIPLPRDAAATFESRHHGVRWQARVSLQLTRRTSIERTLRFVVHPSGALGRQAERADSPTQPSAQRRAGSPARSCQRPWRCCRFP